VPLFMEVHDNLLAVTPEAIADAQQRAVELQGKHGVKHLRYWLDAKIGRMFCLVEGPTKEAVFAVRHDARSILPNMIYEVVEKG
jgi:Nickel responsive protein SCO4226-like